MLGKRRTFAINREGIQHLLRKDMEKSHVPLHFFRHYCNLLASCLV